MNTVNRGAHEIIIYKKKKIAKGALKWKKAVVLSTLLLPKKKFSWDK